MSKLNAQTKEKILAAAERVFHENGLKGARTTLIAERAGVSRTMLHYYFRTKEDLFNEVLVQSFGFFLQRAQDLFEGEIDLRTLINTLIDLLLDVLAEKPSLPSFIVNILNENPGLITALPIIQAEELPARIDRLLEVARSENEILSDIGGEDLMINIYGLSVTPYLVAPLIQFKEDRTNADMKIFLEQRREMIKKFVWNGILH